MPPIESPPRTRPRNRRQVILRTAADLFASVGYHNVSTEDIASAVGIRASALYRHVRNKHELLEVTLMSEFQEVRIALDVAEPRDIDSAIGVLAAAFTRRRQMGLLWSRESRHLDDVARQRIREPFFHVLDKLVHLVESRSPRGDPELTAMGIIAVLTSPAYHRTVMSNERAVSLLTELSRAVVETPLIAEDSPHRTEREGVEGVASTSRRVAIMNAATELFSVRGYQTVTMQDIGAAVGATSASLYRHFLTKGDLLTAIMTRATDALQLGLGRALAAADSPSAALGLTVDSYVEFATHHRDLLGVLVTELPNIPEPARHNLRRGERAYVAEWIALLEAARPEFDRAEVQFRVHAALTIINDAVRTAHLSRHSGVAENITRMAGRVLGL